MDKEEETSRAGEEEAETEAGKERRTGKIGIFCSDGGAVHGIVLIPAVHAAAVPPALELLLKEHDLNGLPAVPVHREG